LTNQHYRTSLCRIREPGPRIAWNRHPEHRTMRLSQHEQQAIRTTVREMDPLAQIYLYGSRTDDRLRGGDIDILILSQRLTRDQRIDIKVELKKHIGDQRIDIIIDRDTSRPFTRIAYEQGVAL